MSDNTLPSVEEIKSMTRKQLVKMDSGTMRRIMGDAERYAAFEAVVNTGEGISAISDIVSEITQPIPEVVDEETEDERLQRAALDAQKVTAVSDAEEAAKKAEVERADAEALLSAGIVVTKDASGNIVKITKKYQAKDENGNPIGHPTHLEAKSWPELSVKQQAAHENGLRLAERIKKQKITRAKNEDQTGNPAAPLTPERVVELLRVLQESSQTSEEYIEAAALMDSNRGIELQLRQAALEEREAALKFALNHKDDFELNQANLGLINRWIRDNNLAFTEDNLEVAALALQDRLSAKQSLPVTATIPVNQTPGLAEVPAVAVAPVTLPQAAAAAPSASAQAIKPVSTQRPGVVGGIQPGSLTASRQVPTSQPTLTKKDIARMGPAEMRRRKNTEPGFTELLERVANSKG